MEANLRGRNLTVTMETLCSKEMAAFSPTIQIPLLENNIYSVVSEKNMHWHPCFFFRFYLIFFRDQPSVDTEARKEPCED